MRDLKNYRPRTADGWIERVDQRLSFAAKLVLSTFGFAGVVFLLVLCAGMLPLAV